MTKIYQVARVYKKGVAVLNLNPNVNSITVDGNKVTVTFKDSYEKVIDMILAKFV